MIVTINTARTDKSRRKLSWGDFWVGRGNNPEHVVGVDFTQGCYAQANIVILTKAGFNFLGGDKILKKLNGVLNLSDKLNSAQQKVRKARLELLEPCGSLVTRELDFATGEYSSASFLIFNASGVRLLSHVLNVYGFSELAAKTTKLWQEKASDKDPFLPTLLRIHLPQDTQCVNHSKSADNTICFPTSLSASNSNELAINSPIIIPGCGGPNESHMNRSISFGEAV